MMYTVRPKSGIGKKLSDTELEEFNQITYDKLKELKNLPKLMRLEQYMREEGFPQTADMARQMVIELGGKDSCPLDWEPQFADVDAEFDVFLKNFDSWQASVKGADENLRGLQLAKEDGAGQSGKIEKSASVRKQRSNANVSENMLPCETPKKSQKKDVRSGRTYYEQWDKYAADAEKEFEEEEKANAEAAKTKSTPESNGDKTEETKSARKETLQQRLLSIGRSKSMTERQWFAEREREKGNDLFNAREYSSSVDAYTMAAELYPESSLAYGNRAAANIKLKKWEDAYNDCCKALALDPGYVKVIMRRGLANLEMDKPDEAMQDLQAALALDPNSQETQSLIRRTEPVLKKFQEKQAEELELQKKRAEQAEHEKTSPVTTNPRCSKRMSIEEVDETANAVNSMCDGHHREGEVKVVHEVNMEEQKKVYSWPSKSYQGETERENLKPVEGKSEPSESVITQGMGSLIGRQDFSKDEGKSFGVIVDHTSKIANGATQSLEDSNSALLQPRIIEDGYPREVLEAMETQASISEGHVAFGKSKVKPDTKLVATMVPRSEAHSGKDINNENSTKVRNQGMLAEEWRLSGNSFFARGDIKKAEECYTTSLTFCHSPATLSNRAMCRIKLKNYKGAEEDASVAISMDPKFHKAYYRRGLARRRLGNVQAAKADFQEVLKATPGDKDVMAELMSLQSEYIPMRVGPMTFEEIADETSTTVLRREAILKNAPNFTDSPRSQHSHGNAKGSQCDPQSAPQSSQRVLQCSLDEAPGIQIKLEVPVQPDPHHSKGAADSAAEDCSQVPPPTRGDFQCSQGPQICPQNSRVGADDFDRREPTPQAPRATPVLDSPRPPMWSQNMRPPDDLEVTSAGSTPPSTSGEEGDLERRAEVEKEKGNMCFKRGQYTLAVDCYTLSLELVPTRAVVLANRALCYIYLREYKKAVDDSTEAIRLAPGYTKAFHRRGTALRKLGDLHGALNDYQVVATFSSNDKKLNKDIEELEKEIERNANVKAIIPEPAKPQPILISEPPEENDFLQPVKTTIYKTQETLPLPTQINSQQSPANGICSSLQVIAAAGGDSPAVKPLLSGEKVLPVKIATAAVIMRKPSTALEFERVCSALTQQPEVARDYMKLIEVEKYPTLFKESLSAGIMKCFVSVLRKSYMPDDALGAVAVLRGLSRVKRFTLTLLLMKPADKVGLETLLYWLEYSSDIPAEEVNELRALYQIA